ncbi:MAG: RNase adapter RapZ [Clostridia bacterium]|nr:RNase adapter RapZ [Clostridia bacterium]
MQLVILSGMSGAGKTQALKKFEDSGYFCVDNLPSEMCRGLVELCARAVPPVEKAAVVIDGRETLLHRDPNKTLIELEESGMDYRIVFLDCRDEVLERRYNETRRRHPLSDDVRTGIRLERERLASLRDRASVIIDTTSMRPLELGAALEKELGISSPRFHLGIMSFGYKRGVPFEADVVMDMRFSPNPFYDKELRALSGRDEAVRRYVMADESVTDLMDATENMLDALIPKFIQQDKRRLVVAFGCTGGRHRSVCAAEELYRRMKDKYHTALTHRDLINEGSDIKERTGERS